MELRKLIFFAIIAPLLILCAGCVTWESQINDVHIGMNQTQVVGVLGKPSSHIQTKDGNVIYYYSLDKAFVGYIPYYVKFVGGKVDSYGREDGLQVVGAPSSTTPIIAPVYK
jgi:hypothetical protein